FCDPASYPSMDAVQQLTTQGLPWLLECTLHMWTSISKYFGNEVKVFGEVDLDYSTDPSKWGYQHEVLDRVLKQLQTSQS
ncbi:MAG: hypothetical protein AB2693_17230, partial [Candidatus Thiodiazotropha sp.]